ncbi:hypothetical protein PV04_06085 [Phialophora macrospora]|uniref:tripeptidyl-peptidase II n=1 Tax=Phialophora macrospora TaxID=1851006 RepID=A0A0D2FJ26_9EURO|nr:hypothetical protein PV04_06085 [Phialophora macrospora]
MLVNRWLLGASASLLSLGNATPNTEPKIHEQLDSIPEGWYQGDTTPGCHQRIKLHIAVRQEDKHDLLEERLLSISTPGHALYGQHYDAQQLSALLQPDPAVSSAIRSWLIGAGISETVIQDDGDWFTVYMTVAQAETLLDTKFQYFHHADLAEPPRIRTLQYSVPHHLHPFIQMIQPTTHFARAKPYQMPVPVPDYGPGSATKLNATYCNATTPPDCIRALYKIGEFKANASSGVKLGISGFNYQQVIHSDLHLFLDKWAPTQNKTTVRVVTSNGGVNNESAAVDWASEASMDVQYGVSLAYDIPVTFYKTGGVGPLIPDLQQPNDSDHLLVQEPWLEHLQFLLNLTQKDLPTVLSVSYGEDEQSHPVSYMKTVCQLFAKLGARGVSVLVASGDGGPGDGCMTNDGKNTTRFQPQFPASCPWVTSVGGTALVQPEIAWNMAGGGFSDVFARPDYQVKQVGTYLNDTVGPDRFKGLYNRTGRGIPDVAAQAYTTFPIFHMGKEVRSGGTSAATPIWATVIANINSERLSRGRKPLGFLNPWLYSEGSRGITDITDGGSFGCEDTNNSGLPAPEVPGAGWNATTGWDAVTGLGTPDFEKLLKIAMN